MMEYTYKHWSHIHMLHVTIRSCDMWSNNFRWTLLDHYEHVSLEHYFNNISNIYQSKIILCYGVNNSIDL